MVFNAIDFDFYVKEEVSSEVIEVSVTTGEDMWD
jgi:hypothetical protein